jgi:phage FluMu protein Com
MRKLDSMRRVQMTNNLSDNQIIITSDEDIRCNVIRKSGEVCNKKLAEGTISHEGIKFKCPRCKRIVTFKKLG